MATINILGDSGPRKSNFDPDLARKVTKYYEEHPEELNDKPEVPPAPTDTTQSAGKYILMPQTKTYALSLHALQEACVAEKNSNHPQFTLQDNCKVYRPLTFKENIQARVENYETTHNQDGSERTLDERFFLITKRWHDSCTAIVYQAGTTKFKVVPISEYLITLNTNFKELFLQVDYNTINGTELDSSKGTYNNFMSQNSVLTHASWLAAVEGDEALLKSYANIIFTEFKRKYNLTEGMIFGVRQDTPTDELRALLISVLDNCSSAGGNFNFKTGGSFVQIANR